MALDLSTPPPSKKASTPRAPRAKYEPPAPPLKEKRAEDAAGFIQLVGAGCTMFGQVADGATCIKYAEPTGQELAELAEESESLARIVDYLGKAGPYAKLIAILMPFGLQIMVNHGRLQPGPFAKFGVVTPEQLTAELQAKLLEEQREAMETARQAQEKLAEEQAKFAQAKARAAAAPANTPEAKTA